MPAHARRALALLLLALASTATALDGYSPGRIAVTSPLTGSDRPRRQPRSMLGTGCPPAISINGQDPWEGPRLDDIAPDAVASMEIYEPKRRGGRVPVDFTFYGQAINCGLVVVWLR